jgi:hypothetical protein
MKKLPHEVTITNDNKKVYMHKSEDVFKFYKGGDTEKVYFSAFDPITKCTYYLYDLSECYIEDESGIYHKNSDYYFQEREIFEGHYYKFKDKGKDHRLIVYYHKENGTLQGSLQTFE